jgi:flagellar hook-length control protein FliK
MLESKNTLMDIGRVSTPAQAAPAGLAKESIGTVPDKFSALLGDAAASLKAAKSGRELPLSGQPHQQAREGESLALLSSRILKGGTELIVGGDEPTDAGLIAFARAQGMDPKALGLLTASPLQVPSNELQSGVTANPLTLPSVANGAELNGSELQRMAANPDATNIAAAEQISAPVQQPLTTEIQTADKAVPAGLVDGRAIAGSPAKEQLSAPVQQPLTTEIQIADKAVPAGLVDGRAIAGSAKPDQQPKWLQQGSQPAGNSLASPAQLLKQAVAAATNPQTTSPQATSPQATNSQASSAEAVAAQAMNPQSGKIDAITGQAIDSKILKPDALKSDALKSDALKLEAIPQKFAQQVAMSAAKASMAVATEGSKTLDIKPKTAITSGKLSVASEVAEPQLSQSAEVKLTVGPKTTEAFLKQHRDRQHLPPTKMDAINLVESKLLTATSPGAINAAPLVVAGAAPAALFVDGQAATVTAQSGLSADLSTESPAEDARQDSLRRQDGFMQLSRQLTDALGKRLTAQIQSGSWRVEMELHPKSLGRVEVQLEMKNGELEARFITANATTRDMINEGMPRLREAFQEHGTETASMDLGTANQGASDGKSTASELGAEESNGRLSSEVGSDSSNADQSLSANGLDVLV